MADKTPTINIDEDPYNANWLRIVGAKKKKAAGEPLTESEEHWVKYAAERESKSQG